VVQIPFMNTPLYVGPISAHINGADLSWLVGLLVTSPLYFWLASRDSAYKRRLEGGEVGGWRLIEPGSVTRKPTFAGFPVIRLGEY
jgi:hypothetical protein